MWLNIQDEASKVRDELERLQTEKVDNEHELQESQKQVICLQEQVIYFYFCVVP